MLKYIKIILVLALCCVCCGTSLFDEAKSASDDVLEVTNLPIIMYHSVLKRGTGKYVVSPSRLEEDFKYIKENGFTPIVVDDLINFKEKNKKLPARPIMITFDDGSRSTYINAFPLMKKYEIKCIVSIVGAYTDSNYDCEGKPLPNCAAYLKYDDIKEMHESGLVEFQNHSYNMHNLNSRRGMNKKRNESAEEYYNILTADLNKLQQTLKDKANITCTAVTFPFGSFCNQTIEIIKELGYKASFTCTEGINLITKETDFYRLKRYNRPQGTPTEAFFKKLQRLPK